MPVTQVREGMELVLVHVCTGETAVPFSKFFEAHQTPTSLVSAGIYNGSMATPLYHGDYRLQSMAMILRSLLRPPNQRSPSVVGHQLEKEVGGNHKGASGGDHNNGAKVGFLLLCTDLHMTLAPLPPRD